MRRVEVDRESSRAVRDVSEHGATRQLLEEVLDQVLLREPLDRLDLLHRHSHLIRNRPGKVELGRPLRDDRAQQLPTCDERHDHAFATPAPAELAAELAQPELFRCLRFGRSGPPTEQALPVLFREIEVHAGRAEEVQRATDCEGPELVERLRRRDLFAELGQVLELADTLSHLLVEARILDRARDERRARGQEVRLGLRELPRGLGVQADDADGIAASADQRHRDERLKPLLLELGFLAGPRRAVLRP